MPIETPNDFEARKREYFINEEIMKEINIGG